MELSLPGAHLAPDGCRFALWAPNARRVVLRLPGRAALPMLPQPRGWHTALVHGLGHGQRYAFSLDGGPDRADPASRWQPDGIDGPSAVADPDFDWTDDGWPGLDLRDLVVYELHVGAFTHEGTFDAAVRELPRLRDLGVTAVEVMPVAAFPGSRNWGYDGVFPFAVQETYGGPLGFKRFIDAAHRLGLGVLLDVVYNHLGPEGNYFRDFGPYFTQTARTPWGDPFNLDGPGSDAVREYFLHNARQWQEEYHLDGLRLDAVPFIKDGSPEHLLAEIARTTRARGGRPFLLVGESDLNDARILRPPEQGGYGLHAQWADDFHHALHALLTGERFGYYADHGTVGMLARALKGGYALTGQYSLFRDRRYGAPADDRPSEQFVVCAQNHDQVGNRLRSDRLSAILPRPALKLVAGLLLLSPFSPLLFMGEEYGETAPFPFFIDHRDARLRQAVRDGRRREFAPFFGQGEPQDPADPATFRAAKLDARQALSGWGKEMHDWHRDLLALRRRIPRFDRHRMEVVADEERRVLTVRQDDLLAVAHFGKEAQPFMSADEGRWALLIASIEMPERLAANEGVATLPPWAFAVWRRAR
ncbi:MAG: malto-oligosyltrehalose trehalohydrolase [Gemmataceae bacterium]|nr:malto-oligosyltrehalose trehalohydrolase [Gemmataceae bacterium]